MGGFGFTKYAQMYFKNLSFILIFIKPRNHIVSTIIHRSYPCINKDDYPVTCNSTNVVYLVTCSACHLQYVGETAQRINVRFDINIEIVSKLS